MLQIFENESCPDLTTASDSTDISTWHINRWSSRHFSHIALELFQSDSKSWNFDSSRNVASKTCRIRLLAMQGRQISMPVNRMTGQHFPNFFCRTNERLGPSEQINFNKFWAEFAKTKKTPKNRLSLLSGYNVLCP